MRNLSRSFLLASALGAAHPALSETNLGDIVSGVAQSLVGQQVDQSAFSRAQGLNTASAYRDYLRQFPKGAYRNNAQRELERLGASVDPDPVLPGSATDTTGTGSSAAAVEADIGLTRSQRLQIQQQLTALGYSIGTADGLWGARTRTAISDWQTKNALPATGYVTVRQVRLIGEQAGPVAGTTPTPVTGGSGDAAVEERLLGLTLDERREVQRRLTELGYRTGGADGSFGANTRRALSAWQQDEGLSATGYLTADQLRELRRQTAG